MEMDPNRCSTGSHVLDMAITQRFGLNIHIFGGLPTNLVRNRRGSCLLFTSCSLRNWDYIAYSWAYDPVFGRPLIIFDSHRAYIISWQT